MLDNYVYTHPPTSMHSCIDYSMHRHEADFFICLYPNDHQCSSTSTLIVLYVGIQPLCIARPEKSLADHLAVSDFNGFQGSDTRSEDFIKGCESLKKLMHMVMFSERGRWLAIITLAPRRSKEFPPQTGTSEIST